ncbi:chorismate mutase [Paenibacillus sp. R14(2021)]|uniref:chorismate mutase n=1 Tax=Paenibacillus sp. R14(2021) TaxID=2859228 RepID=UPI001C616A80|nr:chorismate mutase [Paenibacillus sp. R14(2021)]
MTKTLDQLRAEIDGLNLELLYLLNKRAEVAIEIGQVKKGMAKEVFDPERERHIFNHLNQLNDGPLTNEMVQKIFKTIMDEASRLQRETMNRTG